ncbi:MAG: hypothetical protein RIS94_304 [Pseudomonadota bacterium]
MTTIISYTKRLRAARTAFRERDTDTARELALGLIADHGRDDVLDAFVGAINRYLNATMRAALRAGDHHGVMRHGEPLLAEPDHRDAARAAFIGAARAALSPEDRVTTLRNLESALEAVPDYWTALAEVVGDLPPLPENIELGFEVLERLPGHDRGLHGLHTLVDRYRQAGARQTMNVEP